MRAAALRDRVRFIYEYPSLDTSMLGLSNPVRDLRYFEFEGRNWFAKKVENAAAVAEQANARKAATLLDGKSIGAYQLFVCVPLLTPLANGVSALVSPDLGPTLPANPEARYVRPEMDALLNLLLETSLQWKGFAPRNLVVQPHRRHIWMIDLENTILHSGKMPPIPRNIRLKWILNWSQVWPQCHPFLQRLKSLPVAPTLERASLDSFELALHDLIGDRLDLGAMLDLSDKATLTAEAPLTDHVDVMPPLEVGHLLDEILPPRTSVLTTFLFAHLRLRDPIGFVRLMRRITGYMTPSNSSLSHDALRDIIFAILDAGDTSAGSSDTSPCYGFHAELRHLDGRRGLGAVDFRVRVLDRLLLHLMACIKRAFPILRGTDILLRGSHGQRLTSCKSDIDFEISDATHPDGSPELEALLSELLSWFGVASEGSEMRPVEPDLNGQNGTTRDANEWSQLRRPGDTLTRPFWLREAFPEADHIWWKKLSIYEAGVNTFDALHASYAFKAARATLARAAASVGYSGPDGFEQMATLRRRSGNPSKHRLLGLVETALRLREDDISDPTLLQRFAQDLSAVCRDLHLPDPYGSCWDNNNARQAIYLDPHL